MLCFMFIIISCLELLLLVFNACIELKESVSITGLCGLFSTIHSRAFSIATSSAVNTVRFPFKLNFRINFNSGMAKAQLVVCFSLSLLPSVYI